MACRNRNAQISRIRLSDTLSAGHEKVAGLLRGVYITFDNTVYARQI
jgi:hypothetical protein